MLAPSLHPPLHSRPPRSVRNGLPLPKPSSPTFLSHIPLQPIPLKLRSRPPSPSCDGQQNVSLCSTRSSSTSSKTIRRSISVSEQRKSAVELPPPVACSAKAWVVLNAKTGKVVGGKMEDEPREIASLTKIMTLYAAIQLSKELDISLTTEVTVSSRAASMIGTSACLRPGDKLRLIDVFHGMMLPSGNDAAQCLAEFFGRRISEHRNIPGITKDHDRLFIREMNFLSDKLHLRRTIFQNPHGMSIKRNHSSARDVSTLAAYALKLALFRSIVHTRVYTCKVVDRRGEERSVSWENTNKLLEQGYEGVKTGITDAAGPCLCASWRENDQRVIVTLLNSKSMEERWEEVPRLVAWSLPRLQYI